MILSTIFFDPPSAVQLFKMAEQLVELCKGIAAIWLRTHKLQRLVAKTLIVIHKRTHLIKT